MKCSFLIRKERIYMITYGILTRIKTKNFQQCFMKKFTVIGAEKFKSLYVWKMSSTKSHFPKSCT